MANPSNFQITPCVENHENFHLYRPRRKSAQSKDEIKWPVYEIPDLKAEVVARAQGRRFQVGNGNGNWHSTFSLVFEDGRFKGSTLQVMGIAAEQGKWDIVAGTGQFARATGVISKKLHDENWGILEFATHTFCPLPKGSRSLLTKIGPWGGNRGTFQDIKEAPRRLKSITVCISEGEVVNSIAFSYIDHDGQKRTAGPWGGSGGERYKIKLRCSEFVKEVSGTFDKYKDVYKDDKVITSLKFVTNVKTYGRFGDISGKGTRFSVPVQDSSVIVGFFGRGEEYLKAVGVYVHPF